MAEENGSTKKNQWTGTWTYTKNGINISENFTFRDDDWDLVKARRVEVLGALTKNTQPFPNDSGPVATPPAQVVQGLGNCEFCGAPKIMSKKGKPYCSAKCWLKGQA